MRMHEAVLVENNNVPGSGSGFVSVISQQPFRFSQRLRNADYNSLDRGAFNPDHVICYDRSSARCILCPEGMSADALDDVDLLRSEVIMPKEAAELEEWRKAYEAAIRVKAMAPWEFMTETDMFGVENPETGELGFISVMGLLGEHYAIAVYLGSEGLYGYWSFHDMDFEEIRERMFEVPQLQTSFENKDQLERKDRDIIQKLGLTFRGRNAWPLFRSCRPGFFPWHVEAQELRFLTCALEQSLNVIPRFRDSPSLLEPGDDTGYLVRVSHTKHGETVWEDRIMHIASPTVSDIPVIVDAESVRNLMKLPRTEGEIEIDLFMIPAAIREKGKRPYSPYMLLAVDARNSMVLGGELLSVQTTLEEMRSKIPSCFVQMLLKAGHLPRTLGVRSTLLSELLRPLAKEVHLNISQEDTLPNLENAKASLIQYMTQDTME